MTNPVPAVQSPVLRVAAKEGLLGEGKIHRIEIPSAAGMTARRVIDVVRKLPSFERRPLAVAVNGRRLTDRETDLQLPDGAEVLVASTQHGAEVGAFIVQALITAVIGAAINYVVSLVLPKPKRPGLPQERGEESSATYAWDGIQTSYGQGQPVPFGYGRHAVGGQVIYSEVSETSTTGGLAGEYLRLLLALGEGPIHRVGDVVAGEQDLLGFTGPLPSSIRINRIDLVGPTQFGVLAWLRAGEINQSPIGAPFAGAATTYSVSQSLQTPSSESVFAIDGSDEIASLSLLVSFPNGLYVQDPLGALTGAQWPWILFWRPSGEATWRQIAQSTPGAYWHLPPGGLLTIAATLPPGTSLPIEVRLQRLGWTAPPAGQISDYSVWRHIVVYDSREFSYPGVAILGLQVRAEGRLQGALPQIQVTCDLLKVRVWDESTGWSEPCWDVPPAPFNWMQRPPGRNPAWQAADLCLDELKGLGRWIKEDDLDLPSLRRWSLFCDTEPNAADPWDEAAFQCDVVFDSPRPAWERLLQICAAGRCSPVWVGRKLTFVYQYRDAHSDSLVSVPAKTPVQLFTSTNVEDLRINWLTKRGRSTVIQYQFLNEAKNYEQDVLTIEDPEGTQNDRDNPLADVWQPEVTQAYGVTRESQLLREGVFTHRLQRLVTHEIVFVTGPWALAATVGDLVLVENEVLRPFAADVPMSCTIEADVVASDTVVVDHVVSGSSLRIVFRNPDGEPAEVAISSLTALPGGRTQLLLASPISAIAGAPAVVGAVAKLTKPYLIVGIGLTQDMRREVRCLEWKPAAFDPIGPDFFSEVTADDPAPGGSTEPEVFVQALREGGHSISWSSGPSTTRRARVWAQRDGVGAWLLLGESVTGSLVTRVLGTQQGFRIAISIDDGRGSFPPVESLVGTSVVVPEFPPITLPPIRRLTVEAHAGGLLFRWPEQWQRDFDYYELRAGASWLTARAVYRGKLAEAFVGCPPSATVFQVAARSVSGLYGEAAVVTLLEPWQPECRVAYLDRDELASSPGGTLDSLVYDDVAKVLRFASADSVEGSYTALEIDGGYVAPWHWRVDVDHALFDDGTCGEETGTCGDGEAIWSTCAGRPPSAGRPGVAFDDVLIGDDDGLCGDDSPFETVSGGVGEVGHLAAVRVESRFHNGDAWSDWGAHVDGERVSQKLQVRLRVERASTRTHVEVTRLAAKGYL
ncbi:MAG: hypothetical protein JNL08_05820 [Planctomycetes bacterium]|nr:hypothetical protein [Planctomycetota bacterium]